MKKIFIISFLLITVALFLSAAPLALAQTPIAGEHGLLSGVSDACYNTGDCSICDLVGVVNSVIKLVLGLVGSIALIVFIYGGIMVMYEQKWDKGKKIMINAIIGIAMIFFSYTMVNFALNVLITSSLKEKIDYSKPAQIFGIGWSDICGKRAQ